MIANLGALKSEYATATDAARKAEIHKQYNEGIEKAKAMEGKLVAAAESAYAEAPNADPKIVEILVAILGERVKRDDYEAGLQTRQDCSWTISAPTSTCRAGRRGRLLRERVRSGRAWLRPQAPACWPR